MGSAPAPTFVDPLKPLFPPRRADGGPIVGAGTSASDSILIRASSGEYIQRAAAVAHYGLDFMDRLNRLQILRYAGGGPVVHVAGGSSHSVSHSQEIAQVVVQGVSMDEALHQVRRMIERERRATGWSGGARGWGR